MNNDSIVRDTPLATTEIAVTQGVHRATVHRWITRDGLKARKVGRAWMVLESDLEAFLERQDGSKKIAANRIND